MPAEPIPSSVEVVILQHPLESKKTTRTDHFIRKVIENVELIKARKLPESMISSHMVILFPKTGSVDLAELRDVRTISKLIIIDGTWQHAKEMANSISCGTFVHLTLPENYVGSFTVRKPPEPGFVSTAEALAIALDTIEGGSKKADAMRSVLGGYSRKQIGLMKSVKHSREKAGYIEGLYEEAEITKTRKLEDDEA